MTPAFTDLACHGTASCLIRTGKPDVTYAELAGMAQAFARRLGQGKRLVAIEALTCPEMIAAYLAALGSGHAVALLPAGDTVAMDRFRRQYAPDVVYARKGGRWRLVMDGRAAGALHPDLALILLTSGSTGHGKGVRLSGAALAANARSIATYLDLTAQDRAALVLPLHYSYGLSVLNAHLSVGASVWLAEGSILSDGFLDALRDAGATNLSTVPHGYELLERVGLRGADLPALKTLTVAGGGLKPSLQRDFARTMAARGGRFFAMYGQTEATARIAYLPPELAISHAGMIGQAIPGGALSLLDGSGKEVAGDGVEGELVYRGPNVMMGYATGRADLARGHDIDALPTGDIARREGGLYRIVGRKRRMSKIAGLRVGHDAIEAALAEAGIAAAVWGDDSRLHVAFTGERDPQSVAAHVVAASGLTPSHVRARRVDALPRLCSGKVDYETLRLQTRPDEDTGIAAAFALAFHPRPVGPKDSFATLGGDSLRHVELSMALERALGHIPDGWEQMPLAELDSVAPAEAKSVTIGSDLVIRALAILAVVVTHETRWPVFGGAASMVVLIGFLLARFQLPAMARGDALSLTRPLGRVLLPNYAILAGFALAWGQVPWGSVFLISNFGIGDPVNHDRLPFLYWFVEAYAQMLLLLAALVAVPPVRRLVARSPFAFGLCLLALAMVLRVTGPSLLGLGGRMLFTVPWVLYLLALGWLVAVARGRQRWAVLALASIVLPLVAWMGGNWYGSWIKYSIVWAVVATLIFVPRVTLPRAVAAPVLALASSSYLIYLTHRLVPEVVMADWPEMIPGWMFSTLSILGGIALGMACAAVGRGMLRVLPLRRAAALSAHPA